VAPPNPKPVARPSSSLWPPPPFYLLSSHLSVPRAARPTAQGTAATPPLPRRSRAKTPESAEQWPSPAATRRALMTVPPTEQLPSPNARPSQAPRPARPMSTLPRAPRARDTKRRALRSR
jgi:hypothetical protein